MIARTPEELHISVKQFEQMRRRWYVKLKKGGFVDQEHIWKDGKPVAVPKFGLAMRYLDNRKNEEAIRTYIDIAQDMLWSGVIAAEHIQVWSMHCDGAYCRQIEDATEYSDTTVWRIIKRYQRIVEARAWHGLKRKNSTGSSS